MITTTVSLEDYIAAHRLHHQRGRRIMYAVDTIVVLVGIALAMFGVKWWLIVVFGGIGGALGQLWNDYRGLPAKVEKLYKQFKGISEPMTCSWDAEYVEGSSSEGSGRRKWRDYLCLKENEEVFLLYLTDQLWHVYPKRCFSSKDQLAEFRLFANTAGKP